MNKDEFKYILKALEQQSFPQGFARDYNLPASHAGKIICLIGIRRVGKTFILFNKIQELLSQGIDRRSIVYLNFEDDRIVDLKPKDFDLILQAHGELYPDLSQKKRYYFFDEIQNAPGWERFCRRLIDTENAEIVVTGSSSQFLAREIATVLRGRSITIEVFPLSFSEFLRFRKVVPEQFSKNSEQIINSELEAYIAIGGLPEVVLVDEAMRQYVLQEYADLIFYKDLVDRYKITNTLVMKELLRACFSAPAKLINLSKIFNDFKSRGFKVGRDTIYQYIEILSESFFIFQIPVAEKSLRKRAINPKKNFLIDWSVGYTYQPKQIFDRGHKLENAVFLHERRKTKEIGYLLKPSEIDIVTPVDNPSRLINVCWSSIQKDTLEREIQGLEKYKGNKAQKILVIHEGAYSVKANKDIKVMSATDYLLEKLN